MTANNSKSDPEVIQDLVVAILAVNFWTLEKVYALREELEAQGLFDLAALAQQDTQAVTAQLVAAGYQRGGFPVPQMADRLIATAKNLLSGKEAELRALLAAGNTTGLDRFLLELKGVGPVVAENFRILRSGS